MLPRLLYRRPIRARNPADLTVTGFTAGPRGCRWCRRGTGRPAGGGRGFGGRPPVSLARRGPAVTAPAARPGARLTVTLLGLTVVLLASSLVIGLTGGESWTAVLGSIPVEVAFAVVGALVAARTGNRLGWLFLGAGTVSAVTVATNAYAARAATAELPAAAWVGWIFTVILGIVAPLFFLTPLLFPDGRLPSPRWRPVVWVAVISGLAEMVVPGAVRRQLLLELPQAAGSGDGRRAARDGLQRGDGGRAAGASWPARPP